MKKEFIRLSAVLCIITLVAGMVLAGVDKITAPKIALAEKVASEEAMKGIIPEAESFKTINDNVTAALSGDECIGYCVKVETVGYGGKIVMMVGLGADENGGVKGIEILSHSETAGLGANIVNDDFKKQFAGKDVSLQVVKGDTKKQNEIKALTGATISSRAIAAGVESAAVMAEDAVREASK